MNWIFVRRILAATLVQGFFMGTPVYGTLGSRLALGREFTQVSTALTKELGDKLTKGRKKLVNSHGERELNEFFKIIDLKFNPSFVDQDKKFAHDLFRENRSLPQVITTDGVVKVMNEKTNKVAFTLSVTDNKKILVDGNKEFAYNYAISLEDNAKNLCKMMDPANTAGLNWMLPQANAQMAWWGWLLIGLAVIAAGVLIYEAVTKKSVPTTPTPSVPKSIPTPPLPSGVPVPTGH